MDVRKRSHHVVLCCFFLTRKPHEDNGVEITFWFFKRVCPDKSFVLITSLVFTMMYNNNLLQKLQL